MTHETITAHVRVDKRMLRTFGLFNTFSLQKRWRQPALFSVILLAFAVACYLSGKPQAVLIGTLLAVLGVGLPVAYVLMFLSQIKAQAKQLKLDKPRPAYTLHLTHEGLDIQNDMKQEDPVHVDWANMHAAWHVKNIAYLYVLPSRAFLLPDGQADAQPQEVWDYLCAHMDASKLHVKK